MIKQFAVEQKSLLAILASMQPICSKRTTLDMTTSILFQVGHRELVLKSTDLEISLQASCDIYDSTFTNTESFLVQGKRIFDVVKELEGMVVCSLKNNQLALQAGSVKLLLNIQDAGEFPPFPERIENLMHLDTSALSHMLESVSFLIPQNNTNSALNGLFLEVTKDELKMTATDGHCLAQVRSGNYKLSDARSWLLPRRAIFELKKIIEATKENTIFLGMCGKQVVFSGESFNFFTKQLVDPFPMYAAIMDKTDFSQATIERASLLKTVRRSASLLSGQFLATQFSFEPSKLNVSMKNKEVGTLDEELSLQGLQDKAIDIRFYAPYLLSGLQVLPEADVVFYLKNETRPIIFESKQDGMVITYLVMPVSPATAMTNN
jgi:DNA polymerase-3 subunit beta